MEKALRQQRIAASAQRSHSEIAGENPRGKQSVPTSLKNQSVIRAFAVLRAFYYPDEWVAACELSRRAKMHEATVNRFLQSLLDVGAVVRDDKGRYRCVLFVMPGATVTQHQ